LENEAPVILYNDQASHYDQRAGLRAEVPARIAREVARLYDREGKGALLEVGVGTGQIGVELAEKFGEYFGFDHSLEMLRRFQGRAPRRANVLLFQADGRTSWPLSGRRIRTFFGSRSLHHLPAEHLLREAARVGDPEGYLIVQGAIRRKKDSVLEQISGAMQENLEGEGYKGHKRRQWKKALMQASEAYRAVRLPEIPVAEWPVTGTPAQALRSWASKQGLAGLDLPQAVKERVLEKTERWALARFGSLTREIESTEEYELFGISFPPRSVEHGDQ
jgi:ubiquinone/menaquinone biosynthesis C-methylase UbiE